MQSFNLPNAYECTLDAVPAMAGLVRINTITPGPLPWDGIYFENVPVEIEAVAQPGYLFEKWETNQHIASGDMEQFTKLNTVPLFTDDLYQAHFIPCPEDASATVEAGDAGLSVTKQRALCRFHRVAIGWRHGGYGNRVVARILRQLLSNGVLRWLQRNGRRNLRGGAWYHGRRGGGSQPAHHLPEPGP